MRKQVRKRVSTTKERLQSGLPCRNGRANKEPEDSKQSSKKHRLFLRRNLLITGSLCMLVAPTTSITIDTNTSTNTTMTTTTTTALITNETMTTTTNMTTTTTITQTTSTSTTTIVNVTNTTSDSSAEDEDAGIGIYVLVGILVAIFFAVSGLVAFNLYNRCINAAEQQHLEEAKGKDTVLIEPVSLHNGKPPLFPVCTVDFEHGNAARSSNRMSMARPSYILGVFEKALRPDHHQQKAVHGRAPGGHLNPAEATPKMMAPSTGAAAPTNLGYDLNASPADVTTKTLAHGASCSIFSAEIEALDSIQDMSPCTQANPTQSCKPQADLPGSVQDSGPDAVSYFEEKQGAITPALHPKKKRKSSEVKKKAHLEEKWTETVEESCEWLRRLLDAAELSNFFYKAAAWAEDTGCIQSDLHDEEVLQALIDHLKLKLFPQKRLRKAVAALRQKAPSAEPPSAQVHSDALPPPSMPPLLSLTSDANATMATMVSDSKPLSVAERAEAAKVSGRQPFKFSAVEAEDWGVEECC